jgi:hypothetical protein
LPFEYKGFHCLFVIQVFGRLCQWFLQGWVQNAGSISFGIGRTCREVVSEAGPEAGTVKF